MYVCMYVSIYHDAQISKEVIYFRLKFSYKITMNFLHILLVFLDKGDNVSKEGISDNRY